MIVAATTMEKIPERCARCPLSDEAGMDDRCAPSDRVITTHELYEERPGWCPLREIDETLPAQLECAEARLKKYDRILDALE